ncbi:retrovirus-related pol polyprotein from transposon TNT 1-94 [Tanacetum coccineum]
MVGSFLGLYILNRGEKSRRLKSEKDLTSLSLLCSCRKNLKVHKMIIKKDSEIVKAKGERRSLALKAKKESSGEECSTSGSEDEKYAMAVRDFNKFFKRSGRFVRQPRNDKKTFQRSRDNKNSKGERNDSCEEDDEKIKDETCLVAQASNDVCYESSYFSDENSSIDDLVLDNEYDKLCLRFNSFEASSSETKEIKFVKAKKKVSSDGGNVIFGSNLRGNIIRHNCRSNGSLNIDNVEHVDNLGFNLLSRGIRRKGLYVMKLGYKLKDKICLATIDENSTLWNRRLGHANICLIQSLSSKDSVRNSPRLKFDQHFYDACKIGKQAHASHKAKNVVSTTRCLELLHTDLFGPSAVRSYGRNRYTLFIVDDYSRYTWTRFLKDKTEAFDQFEIFSKKIQNQLGCTIVSIRTDHGREFDNEVQFGEFCNANGITHNFLAPRTPQSNGIVGQGGKMVTSRNEVGTMLNEQSLP